MGEMTNAGIWVIEMTDWKKVDAVIESRRKRWGLFTSRLRRKQDFQGHVKFVN
jgi:hypothetical protein